MKTYKNRKSALQYYGKLQHVVYRTTFYGTVSHHVNIGICVIHRKNNNLEYITLFGESRSSNLKRLIRDDWKCCYREWWEEVGEYEIY